MLGWGSRSLSLSSQCLCLLKQRWLSREIYVYKTNTHWSISKCKEPPSPFTKKISAGFISIYSLNAWCSWRECVEKMGTALMIYIGLKTYEQDIIDHLSENKGWALLPFYGTTSSTLKRLVSKYQLHLVFFLLNKLGYFLNPIKDDIGLCIPGIYQIPCSCGKVYISHTGHTVSACCIFIYLLDLLDRALKVHYTQLTWQVRFARACSYHGTVSTVQSNHNFVGKGWFWGDIDNWIFRN